MSSEGKWEVVGKNKKEKQNKKQKKTEKQAFVDNAPKVEDLLTVSQIQTLYAALDTDNDIEPSKPVEKVVKPKEHEVKKTQKKQQPEKKKQKAAVKKKPKTLEAAVSSLKMSELSALMEISKANIKGTPIAWLKDLASYINVVLVIDHRESVFTNRSFEYPLCLFSNELQNLIKREIADMHPNVVQNLFECCMTSIATDMSKGAPVTGYKLLLQVLATQYPSVVITNIGKYISLRQSYINRPAIGLTILWACGVAGAKDLSVGLKVWQSLMLPVCELRAYTRYVLDYINVLLTRHAKCKTFTSEQYFSIIDSIYSSGTKLPNPTSVELKSNAKQLKEILCNSIPEKKFHTYFEPLLDRISSSTTPLKEDFVQFTISCLTNDQQTFSIWKEQYSNCLPQSVFILKSINASLNSFLQKVPKSLLLDTITSFNSINNSMIKKNQKAAGLQDCNRLCEALLKKMTTTKKKQQSRPILKYFLFTIFISFIAIIAFDVNSHGSFKASSSGKFAKDIGVYPHIETAIKYSKIYYNRIYSWSVKNVPVYYKLAVDTSRPYVILISDYALIAFKHVRQSLCSIWGYISKKLPFISQWIETYAPGLAKKEFWSNIFDNVAQYSSIFLKICITVVVEGAFYFLAALETAVTWLQTNVFTGKLSSENLQKYAIQGIDTAFTFASKAIFWVQEKFVSIYG